MRLLQGLEVDVDEARAHSISAGQYPVPGCRRRVRPAHGYRVRLVRLSWRLTSSTDWLRSDARYEGAEEQLLLDQVATGLMDLAEDVQHSLIARVVPDRIVGC